MHRCTVTWTSPSQPVFKAHLVTGPQNSHLTLETLCRLRSVLGSTTAETSAHKKAFRACAASKNYCGQNNLYQGRDILQEWVTLCIIQRFSVDANIKALIAKENPVYRRLRSWVLPISQKALLSFWDTEVGPPKASMGLHQASVPPQSASQVIANILKELLKKKNLLSLESKCLIRPIRHN